MLGYSPLLFLPLSWTVQLVNAALSNPPTGKEIFDDAQTILIGAQDLAQDIVTSGCPIEANVPTPFFTQINNNLPSPQGNTVTHIALGVGYQNYTCNAGSTDTPVPVGAVANLFDASCLSENTALLSALPATLRETSVDAVVLAAVIVDRFISLGTQATTGLLLGKHYFTGEYSSVGKPTFDFSETINRDIIQAVKLNSASAPSTSPDSVDWLRLGSVTPLGEGTTTNITVSLYIFSLLLVNIFNN
jgi:Protein of unknown function (DUF3455)